MRGLNEFPRPTIALVHGACYGGGVGMVACCDVRIATETAAFALTEVRWGVIPRPSSRSCARRWALPSLRRYGITGERFDAHEARRIGLIHEVCADDALDRAAAPIIEAILRSAPEAVRETKRMVLAQAGLALSEQDVEALAAQAAIKRASPEAAEGLASFEQKRDPAWYRPRDGWTMKLDGIRVVDLSLFLPGPAMTQVMADHGAEVIKVESHEGEPNRRIGPERDGVSVYFANTHRGKKSLILDLKSPAGRGAAAPGRDGGRVRGIVPAGRGRPAGRRLCRGVRACKKIVYVSISAFGQTGPTATGRRMISQSRRPRACSASISAGTTGRGRRRSPAPTCWPATWRSRAC